MWIIIPLVYFLAWWQTGSLRQAFNATVAWILGFAITYAAIVLLGIGGYEFLTIEPTSPGAGVAMLGGFVGMWVSNIRWRRRGGDPPRQPGRWERAARAMFTKPKKKKKKRAPVGPPPNAVPPPNYAPHQPIEANYRVEQPPPAQQHPQQGYAAPQSGHPPQYQPPQQPAPQQRYAAPQTQPPPVPQGNQQAPQQQPQQQHAPAPQQTFQQPVYQTAAPPPPAGQPVPPQNQQAPPSSPKKSDRSSETMDKYAKATGRALGAMFRGSGSKKKKRSK